MARYEVSDELWERIQSLLPVRPRRSRWPGRIPLDDRACLNGILFVLLTGISWVDLPQQLGYGSGMTCWRRLRDWTTAGVWDQLHALLLAELHAAEQIDWSRAAADGSHVRAKRGPTTSDQARSTGPDPVASTISSSTPTASRSPSR
jgi:transposase